MTESDSPLTFGTSAIGRQYCFRVRLPQSGRPGLLKRVENGHSLLPPHPTTAYLALELGRLIIGFVVALDQISFQLALDFGDH
ncbi:hypothetical protein [Brevundimonas sp. DC300-4]|uniref:hypothetical protein n=1 Tax=Brevundimonas sp. DC300-4 TaxID=2804594 RepID=UPI003CF8DA7E